MYGGYLNPPWSPRWYLPSQAEQQRLLGPQRTWPILQGLFMSCHLVTHEFPHLLECSISLLGRDLLTKLGPQITFAPGKPASLTLGSQLPLMMAVPREDGWHLCSSGREPISTPRLLKNSLMSGQIRSPQGLAKTHASIVVDLSTEATPVRQKQYPGPREAWLGIQDHTQRLRDAEILIEGQSPWNIHSYQPKSLEGMTSTLSRTSMPSAVQ